MAFTPFSSLDSASVPTEPGVYVVLRERATTPSFRQVSGGARFKGKDPSVPREVLDRRWVEGAQCVYVGMTASSLRRRLRDFSAFGAGRAVGHWGGRYIWQLADCQDLVVAWKVTEADSARTTERSLLDSFELAHGKPPFANIAF